MPRMKHVFPLFFLLAHICPIFATATWHHPAGYAGIARLFPIQRSSPVLNHAQALDLLLETAYHTTIEQREVTTTVPLGLALRYLPGFQPKHDIIEDNTVLVADTWFMKELGDAEFVYKTITRTGRLVLLRLLCDPAPTSATPLLRQQYIQRLIHDDTLYRTLEDILKEVRLTERLLYHVLRIIDVHQKTGLAQRLIKSPQKTALIYAYFSRRFLEFFLTALPAATHTLEKATNRLKALCSKDTTPDLEKQCLRTLTVAKDAYNSFIHLLTKAIHPDSTLGRKQELMLCAHLMNSAARLIPELLDPLVLIAHVDAYMACAKIMRAAHQEQQSYCFVHFITDTQRPMLQGTHLHFASQYIKVKEITLGSPKQTSAFISGLSPRKNSYVAYSILLCCVMGQSMGIAPAFRFMHTPFHKLYSFLQGPSMSALPPYNVLIPRLHQAVMHAPSASGGVFAIAPAFFEATYPEKAPEEECITQALACANEPAILSAFFSTQEHAEALPDALKSSIQSITFASTHKHH